ncbi:type III pantothenate kinase [Chloroflexota bacterium]
MLLVIDIGNSNITLGVFEEEALKATWRVATVIDRTSDEYAVILLSLLNQHGYQKTDINKAALCSVVPTLTNVFQELCQTYFNTSTLIVGAGIKTGVRILLDNPREAGTDRIVNAAAAHHLYGGPIIIIDMGTATTFDTVASNGDYLGGAISPGLVASAEAIFNRTSQLRRVEIKPPEKAIGTSTVSAMQSGLFYGYVGMIEGVVGRIQKELHEKPSVIATGGYVDMIAKETKIIDSVNEYLTLEGLRLIYVMNRV